MQAADVRVGRVYLVWRNRELRPVYIERKNVHGGFDGHLYPNGKPIRVRDAKKISDEYRTPRTPAPAPAPALDWKSRAAGEREE